MKKLNKDKEIYFSLMRWRDGIYAPTGKWLLGMGVTADQISLLRILLIIPMVWMVGFWLLGAFLMLILNLILDGLDGAMARKAKSASLKGRILDVSIDNFYVIPLVLALIWFNQIAAFWATLYLVNILIDYFINYINFGMKVEDYPFFFNKYFVYFALLLFALGGPNWIDYVIVFWGMTLTIVNGFNLINLYKKD